jgi:hypothetical protein
VRAQGREARRGSRGGVARRGRKGKGKEGGADRWEHSVREREREEALGLGCAEGLRELGLGAAHEGKGGGRGMGCQGEKGWPKGRGKESRPGCWVGLPFLLSSSFLFLFYTETIQIKLFEFK